MCFLAETLTWVPGQPIRIGNDTLIGAYCYIISGNHRFEQGDLPIRVQGYEGEPITIGRNVWLGASCHSAARRYNR